MTAQRLRQGGHGALIREQMTMSRRRLLEKRWILALERAIYLICTHNGDERCTSCSSVTDDLLSREYLAQIYVSLE